MDQGFVDELQWWTNFFAGDFEKVGGWEDIRTQENFPAHYLEHLPAAQDIWALDVGCGPVIRLGSKLPGGHKVNWIGLDPLAAHYHDLRVKHGLEARGTALGIPGEFASSIWPPKVFDFAMASNSLDHSKDPLAVLKAMSTVTRGALIVNGFIDEGSAARGHGLHKWDMTVDTKALALTIQGYQGGPGLAIKELPNHRLQTAELTPEKRWFEAVFVPR